MPRASGLGPFIGLALLVMAFAAPSYAADADAEANKLFVQAVDATHRADNTYDTKESVRLLRNANQLLKKIVANYPQSAIAVQLSTHQLIGDFDIAEFEGRIRALSCAKGSEVENFLSEYGIGGATGPMTDACFLYRMENLLNPPDTPIAQARADWLGVAVSYNISGQEERARGIILPYLAILRKNANGTVAPADSYLTLAKALELTGADTQALAVADHISDCSGHLAYLMTTLNAALWHDDSDDAKSTADQIRNYAENNQCAWQMGYAVQALALTGRSDEAKALYDKIAAHRTEDVNQGPPPALAVAAAMVDEPSQALTLVRGAADHDPSVVAQAVAALSRRGEVQATHDFASEQRDIPRRAQALATLIASAPSKTDGKVTQSWMEELKNLQADAPQAADQAVVVAAVARAEKALYKDDRWRDAFQLALNAAERSDENTRGPLVTSLAATFAAIKAGRDILN